MLDMSPRACIGKRMTSKLRSCMLQKRFGAHTYGPDGGRITHGPVEEKLGMRQRNEKQLTLQLQVNHNANSDVYLSQTPGPVEAMLFMDPLPYQRMCAATNAFLHATKLF